MAKWLEEASQWHEVYCHDLEVMSSNPSRVELGVRSTSVPSRTWTKHSHNAMASARWSLIFYTDFILWSSDGEGWEV